MQSLREIGLRDCVASGIRCGVILFNPVNVGFAPIFMVTRPGLILRFNNEERG
jgi:hypothetical protein